MRTVVAIPAHELNGAAVGGLLHGSMTIEPTVFARFEIIPDELVEGGPAAPLNQLEALTTSRTQAATSRRCRSGSPAGAIVDLKMLRINRSWSRRRRLSGKNCPRLPDVLCQRSTSSTHPFPADSGQVDGHEKSRARSYGQPSRSRSLLSHQSALVARRHSMTLSLFVRCQY